MGAYRRKAQALLHDRRRHKVSGGDVLLAHAAVAQGLERAEPVKRMQTDAFIVLGQGIVLGEAVIADDAGDGLGLRHPLLLHQQVNRTPKRQADASSGLLVALSDGIDRGRQIGEQEIGGFRCRACRADDRTVILAKYFQPGTDVVGVTHGRHDSE